MSFPLGEILFLVFLTILEAFFVMAEIALVSVRRSRIDQLVEEGNAGARRVRRLIDEPGRFLAVASAHGLVASPFKAGYVSAKHGVIGLVRTLALEGAAAGITATAVCPAFVRVKYPSGSRVKCR